MNFLFLKNKWKITSAIYEVTGTDLETIQKNHDLKNDIQIKGIIENIGKADLSIKELKNDKLRVEVIKIDKTKIKKKTILIIAIARPQTVKKVLELSGTLGISEVHFFKSETTVKSYVTSKVFLETNIEKHLIKGMEQSGNALFPRVFIYKNNYELINGYLKKNIDSFKNYQKLIASTRSDIKFSELSLEEELNKIILIGPESGLTESEESEFYEFGFNGIKLSEFILRVETALVYLMSKID